MTIDVQCSSGMASLTISFAAGGRFWSLNGYGYLSVASAEARTAEKVSHWSPWLSVPLLGNHLQLRVLLNLQQAAEVAEPCAQFGLELTPNVSV